MKKALIIGSEGQDGRLLQYLLHGKEYALWGLGRSECRDPALLQGYIQFDLFGGDYLTIANFLEHVRPDEIYYVSAFHQSSQEINTGDSLDFIARSIAVNQEGFIKTMELVKRLSPSTKIFYTSSSLIFSGTGITIHNENTVPEPRCIYSVTKCAAMDAAKFYTHQHGLFVSVGIMYNHESALRSPDFLSQKIIHQTRQLIQKKIDRIEIGDLSSETDWGYAPDYVNAMWHILQQKDPGTFIISSGRSHTVQNWFEVLFGHLNSNWKDHVVENKNLIFRKKPVMIGDNSKLLSTGWRPAVSFEEMVIRMYNNNL